MSDPQITREEATEVLRELAKLIRKRVEEGDPHTIELLKTGVEEAVKNKKLRKTEE